MGVIDALRLEKPVVMGCSIGGRIVLHLALEHATRFRALIGLESAAHAEPYYDLDWLHRPDVHGGEVCGAMISGLIAPTAPGGRPLGDDLALHAGRPRRLQRRPALLHR